MLVPLSLKTDDLPLISDTSPGMKLDSWTLCSVRIDGSLQSCALIIPEYLEALLETQLERVTKISSNQSTASLSNFVDYITSNIQQTLEAACEEYVDRRHFIAALLDLYPRNLADYDSKMYRHGTLYFKIGDICYVTHLAQVKHELQIAFFAVNRLVKGDHREEFPFCEKLTIQLAEKPNSPAFRQYLHETFVIHLDDFMLKVLGVFTKL